MTTMNRKTNMTTMNKTLLSLSLLLSTACAPRAPLVQTSDAAFCFKAEGVSKERCFSVYGACVQRQSRISEQYPFAFIESKCQRKGFGQLSARLVAE